MRIVFFGTPEFAVPSLKILAQVKGIEILSVVTQPDKAVGRKQEMTFPDVKKAALELKLPIIQPRTKKELEEALKDIKADFFIVIAYGMILTEKILNMPKYGVINVHASLLPKYRGASPIQECLLNGDKETGISIMKISKGMDEGDIFLIKRVPIENEDTTTTLFSKLAVTSSVILPLVLSDIVKGILSPLPQNNQKATYCRKIEKEDGKINWNKTAEEIKNMIRAYTPWPNVYTELSGKKIKILEAEISKDDLPPGKIALENNIIKIGTKKGSLIPKKIQLEGKSPMDIKNFLNGYKSLLK
jgi:methionyl-tRNA formyltransferase